jgi:hypothetical protein
VPLWPLGVDAVPLSTKDQANGVPSLDSSGKVPIAELPTGALAGQELDYAQITVTPAAISATTEATAVVIVSGNPVVYDGSKVRLEFFGPAPSAGASLVPTYLFLRDTSSLGQIKHPGLGTTLMPAIHLVAYDTPPAGTHTYKVAAYVTTSTLTINAGPGGPAAVNPVFLRVTKA